MYENFEQIFVSRYDLFGKDLDADQMTYLEQMCTENRWFLLILLLAILQ